MGDLIGNSVDGELFYVPLDEFKRVRKLNCEESVKVKIYSELCRVNVLYMIAKCGSGHIGSSFSSLEIMSYLHLCKLKKGDMFFSSKGHDSPALYNVLIGLEKLNFELIHKLRRLDGLPGHPDIRTPNIITNTGSLGMGISKAKGLIKANRLKNNNYNIYVLTGDGELQEGQFWESLASAANLKLNELVVIIDHNKLQSDTFVEKVSSLGDLEKKLDAFGWHVVRCSGHNVIELGEMLASFSAINDKPKILIADTIKGKGVSFMEHTNLKSGDDLYKYHSGAPSKKDYINGLNEISARINDILSRYNEKNIIFNKTKLESISKVNSSESLISSYSKLLLKFAKKYEEIVALDADLVLDTGLVPFKSLLNKRFIECGIAEQDMVSQAGGLALNGFLPIVHSFSCFLTARANEQIYNNASEGTKIIYVGSLAGILPGGPGHSHQGVRDISLMGSIPNIIACEPACAEDLSHLLDWAINKNKVSTYLRLVSIPIELKINETVKFDYGEGYYIKKGDSCLIFTYGPILTKIALEFAELVNNNNNKYVSIINIPWLNYIDEKWFKNIVEEYDLIYSLDNHYLKGGQGDVIANLLSKIGNKAKFRRMGLNEFPVCGTNDEVLRYHNFDANSLYKKYIVDSNNK